MSELIARDELLKKLFPLGIPKTREDWNYAINAKAVYMAIMKCGSAEDAVIVKPCPFCGCEYTKADGSYVYAGNHKEDCPLKSEVVLDAPKAIEAWNQKK